jgi:hypothetical protein
MGSIVEKKGKRKAKYNKTQVLSGGNNVMGWDVLHGNWCLGLLSAIIHQAIEDLNHWDENTRNSAIEFFYSENFNNWLIMANVSPEYVRKLAGLEQIYIS